MSSGGDVQRFVSSALLGKFKMSERCEQYLDLLEQENRKANLVSRETSRSDLRRLAAESLLPLEVLPGVNPSRYLDIGAGGGLPSIPLLLALAEADRSPQRAVLVERRQKRAGALRRMLVALDLHAGLIAQDFDAREVGGPFDLVTVRLVRLTKRLLKNIGRVLAPDGIFVHFAAPSGAGAASDWAVRQYLFSFDTESVSKTLSVYRRK